MWWSHTTIRLPYGCLQLLLTGEFQNFDRRDLGELVDTKRNVDVIKRVLSV